MLESPANSSDWKKQPEAIALDEQNKVIKQYHSTLLDTVYWALSLVGGVAILLVGASYLINFKLYETDKERFNEKLSALKDELDLLRESQLGIVASLRSEMEANAVAQMERAKTEILITVQAQLASYADRASNEMVGLRSEISTYAERNANWQQLFQIKVEKLLAEEGNLRKEIASVEAIAREAEAQVYDIREYHGAKLIKLCQALRAAAKAGKELNVKYLFKQIERTLSHIFDSRSEVLSDETLGFIKKWAAETEKIYSADISKVLAIVAQIEDLQKTSSP